MFYVFAPNVDTVGNKTSVIHLSHILLLSRKRNNLKNFLLISNFIQKFIIVSFADSAITGTSYSLDQFLGICLKCYFTV